MNTVKMIRRWLSVHGAPMLVIFVVLFNGLVTLSAATFERYFKLHELRFVLFVDAVDVSRSLGFVIGLVLIYLATKLWRRSRMAWLMTTWLSCILLTVYVLFGHDLLSVVILNISIIVLFIYRGQFQVRNDRELLTQGLTRSVLILSMALVYGTFGFWLLFRKDFGQDFSFMNSLHNAFLEIFLFGNDALVAHNHYAHWFINSLDLVGMVAIILAFLSFFEPLQYRFVTKPHEYEFVKDLIEKYGNDSEDFFKLWPRDKRYFISHRAALAYKVKNDIAIILGDPVGNNSNFPSLVNEFYEMARLSGWQVAAVHCRVEASELYEKQKSRSIIVGSEAVINIKQFLEITSTNKHWRNIKNRFTKAGFTSELVHAPISDNLYHELKAVSDKWLKLPGREEMTFGLGYFDKNYIIGSDIMCLRSADNEVVAFANLVHSYDKVEANIDLMRHLPGAPSNVNDYLCYCLIKEISDDGLFKLLNLGLCPLKGVDEIDSKSPTAQVMKLVYGSNTFFSFQGLVRFKSKFEPNWRERYLVYQGGTAGLVRTGLAINKAFRLDKE